MSQDASSTGAHLHRETLAVRLAVERSQYGENSEALYLTSGYVQPSAEDSARRFAGEEDGYTYGRSGNPTVSSFEMRLAAMEGTEACMATASGMAAVMLMCFSLLKAARNDRGDFNPFDQLQSIKVLFAKGTCSCQRNPHFTGSRTIWPMAVLLHGMW